MGEPVKSSADDAAITEFHAAARRRQVRILAIAAAICILISAVMFVVVATLAPNAVEEKFSVTRGRAEAGVIKLVIAGVGFLIAGGVLAWKAVRERRGENV